METQKTILNDKQEWQVPVLEVITSEKTEQSNQTGDDGNGANSLS